MPPLSIAGSINFLVCAVDLWSRRWGSSSKGNADWKLQCQVCSTVWARAHWPLCLATSGRVFVAGIFISVGNHYFQALASTLQFVAQVSHRLWLVPATDRAFAYITYMSPPHVALVCSGPPQCAATCGWTKWPVCSGPMTNISEVYHSHIYKGMCIQMHTFIKWKLISL